MKSTMRQSYISDLLEQLLNNGLEITKKISTTGNIAKALTMVIKKCENTTLNGQQWKKFIEKQKSITVLSV